MNKFLIYTPQNIHSGLRLQPLPPRLEVVKTVVPGDVFGELALLYNCPRAATVKAKDDGKYWKLDRESFSNIVQDAAMKKRDKSARVGNARML